MAKARPPNTRLQLRKGEDPFSAAIRELDHNPDSPASLRIMSAVTQVMAPRERAIKQLVDALEAQMECDGELQVSAVVAAVQHWERECKEVLSPDLLEDFKRQAQQRIERRKRQPPAMDTILSTVPQTSDTGYELGVHLEGLKGTWHRLWAMLCLAHSFGSDISADEGVAAVRQQFQTLRGREMGSEEWDALVAHAKHHSQTMMPGGIDSGNGQVKS